MKNTSSIIDELPDYDELNAAGIMLRLDEHSGDAALCLEEFLHENGVEFDEEPCAHFHFAVGFITALKIAELRSRKPTTGTGH